MDSPHSEMSQSSLEKTIDIQAEQVDSVGDWRVCTSSMKKNTAMLHVHNLTDETLDKQGVLDLYNPDNLSTDIHVKQEQVIVDCENPGQCTSVMPDKVGNQQLSSLLEDVPQTGSGIHLIKIKLEPEETYEHDERNDPNVCGNGMTLMDGLEIESDTKFSVSSQLAVNNPPVPVALFQHESTSNRNVVMRVDDGAQVTGNCESALNDQETPSSYPVLNNLLQYNVAYQRFHNTEDKPHKCSVCDYSSSEKCSLVAHLKTHFEGKPYKCAVCGNCFVCKSQLVRHMRTHTGDKPYMCSSCDFRFVQKSQLLVHTRTHTGEKPFTCSSCDYSAARKSLLMAHMNTHTVMQTHRCTKCAVTSATKADHITHMRTHTEERSHKCSICDYTAFTICNINRHMRTHTGEKPHKCSICDYSSAQRCNLLKHMKTHTGKNPYACWLCDYSSLRKSELATHMEIHTVAKPYRCLTCGKCCATRAAIVMHMKTHVTLTNI